MGKKKHSDLVCTICDTDIEVPLCCKKDMTVKNNMLVCSLCGNNKNIPICCGKGMIVTQPQ